MLPVHLPYQHREFPHLNSPLPPGLPPTHIYKAGRSCRFFAFSSLNPPFFLLVFFLVFFGFFIKKTPPLGLRGGFRPARVDDS